MGYTKLKVGLTTLIALIMLFGGVFWVKSFNPTTRKIRMGILFEDGRSITGGDPVQISGIKVGEVTNVSLNEQNRAVVRIWMNYSRLPSDTGFTIADVGLMGDKALVIQPGSAADELDYDAIQYGTVQADLGSLVETAGEMLERLNHIAGDLDQNLDIQRITSGFDTTLVRFNEALTLYATLADTIRDPLTRSLGNFEDTSTDLKAFVDTNDEKLSRAIESFEHSTSRLAVFIDSMENLPVVVDTLAHYMGDGEGTLGRMLKSDELYEELRQTNASIDSFVVDFKRDPGKYTEKMNFKIRLF